MGTFFENIFGIAFTCGCFFLLNAGVMYLYPPKKVNHFYGYRTNLSTSSRETWEFAQEQCVAQMGKGGLVMILLSMSGYFLKPHIGDLTGGVIISALSIAYIFRNIETSLKTQFKGK